MKKKGIWVIIIVILVAGAVFMVNRSYTTEKPIKAMYISDEEDNSLMVDQDTGNIFTVTMPDKILDKNGKEISKEELKNGNIVAIYGDGIMLESYPGQYPGVTKIKVLKEGKTSDADQYQELLDQIYPGKDPAELPYLNICYTTSYGEVSEALPAAQGGYSWKYTGKGGTVQEIAGDSTQVTNWKDISDVNIEKMTDMELLFDTTPEKIIVTAFPAELIGEADPVAGAEVETEKAENKYILKDVRENMIYLIRGEWENGWVEYGFKVAGYDKG